MEISVVKIDFLSFNHTVTLAKYCIVDKRTFSQQWEAGGELGGHIVDS